MAINKPKVFETLNDHFLLDDDYWIIHEKDFEKPLTAFKELIRVFQTYPLVKYCRGEKIQLDTATNLQHLDLDRLGKNADPALNTLEFIKGMPIGSKPEYHGHQWQLRSYYKMTADLLQPVLMKLLTEIDDMKDFEDLFQQVETTKNDEENELKKSILSPDYLAKINRKKKTLGYGRTCIYDFALRAAYRYKVNKGTDRLLPSRYVYVHARPATTFKILKELGVFKNIPKNSKMVNTIEYDVIKDDFLPFTLDAIAIENFFCVMHEVVCWFDEKYYPKEKSPKTK